MTRTTPPYRADHVGSFLRPERLLEARARRARGEISAEALRAVEDDGDRARWCGGRRRSGFRASPTASSAAPSSTSTSSSSWTASPSSRAASPRRFRRDDGTEVGFKPPTMRVDRPVAPQPQHPGPRLRLPQERRPRSTPKVCIPSPSMLHFRGGREAISAEVYPDLDALLRRPRRRLSRRDRRPRRARLPLPAAGRHQPRLSVRRPDPRGDPRARRRSGRAAAPLLPADQRGDRAAGPPTWRSASTSAAATSRAPGSRRAATSRSPRSCSTSSRSTASSSSTTISARATSRRCASCPRARPWCSAS